MEGEVESLVLQRLTDVENLIVGLAAGVCTQIIVQPFMYFKAATQIRSKEMPFTLNPRIIYRGTAAACCNLGVLTGIQFQFSGVAQKFFTGGEKRPLSPVEEISAGAVGGFVSAPACTLLELMMIQQQRYAGTLWATPLRIYKVHGVRHGLFRGFVCSAVRESMYTAGLLGIVPVCKKYLREEFGFNQPVAKVLSSLCAGFLCASVTNPADFIKTLMQGRLGEQGYRSVTESLNSAIKQHGYRFVVCGYRWRYISIVIDFIVLDTLMETFAPMLFPERFEI